MHNSVNATVLASTSPTAFGARPRTATKRLQRRVDSHAGRFVRLGVPATSITFSGANRRLIYEAA